MQRRSLIVISVLLVVLASTTAISAQNWEDLGSKEVKDRSEQDTWHLGAGKGQFRRLKITVQHRPVRFYKLEVTFTNGQKQAFEIRNLIRAGGETRALDLDGTDRFINKVDVWYEAATVRRGRRSQVTLFGVK
jgi:hypothetical protein